MSDCEPWISWSTTFAGTFIPSLSRSLIEYDAANVKYGSHLKMMDKIRDLIIWACGLVRLSVLVARGITIPPWEVQTKRGWHERLELLCSTIISDTNNRNLLSKVRINHFEEWTTNLALLDDRIKRPYTTAIASRHTIDLVHDKTSFTSDRDTNRIRGL